jgi:predicted NAD-dependent protein-ADP-ribosyltransferase YbiA (DUF1768 family)
MVPYSLQGKEGLNGQEYYMAIPYPHALSDHDRIALWCADRCGQGKSMGKEDAKCAKSDANEVNVDVMQREFTSVGRNGNGKSFWMCRGDYENRGFPLGL